MSTGRLLLLSAVLTGSLALGAPADVPAGAAPAAERVSVRFDRAGLAAEMASLPGDLKGQPTEALQGHVRRLTEQYAALEQAGDLPPSERRTIGENILARVAQVSLLLRERLQPRPEGAARAAGSASVGWLAPLLGWLGSLLFDGPSLLLGLVGGLVIAFALGSLTGYRRGAMHASYYGTESDPRTRFLSRSAAPGDNGGEPGRVSATQLRDMLAKGRTVMLQLGYEIAPERRPRYLELIGEMRTSMGAPEGRSYTVWEDPRHPNRFYELLVCFRPDALDRLIDRDRRLAEIAAEIESCRTPRGPVFRRAWWELPPSAARKE